MHDQDQMYSQSGNPNPGDPYQRVYHSIPSSGVSQPHPEILHPLRMARFTGYPPANTVQLVTSAAHHHLPQMPTHQTTSQVPTWMQNSGSDSIQNAQNVQQFQRLKVEDALSYLDQVKLQFGSQPQVYNDFLDIMKEFKSQSIDTPGVINRVSVLFKGHPDLIVGFNTFLPPGYKIEVANNQLSVRQPDLPVMPLSNLGLTVPSVHHNIVAPPAARPAIPEPHPPATSSAISQLVPAQGQQPVEFNHAISYVNRIKQCYQGRPEIYKRFLDILHNYQKEQKNIKDGLKVQGYNKPITEAEVYSQVSVLFSDQPELLTEFRQFLPDANGGSELMGGLAVADSAMVAMTRNDHASSTAVTRQAMSNKSNNNSGQSPMVRRVAAVQGTSIPPTKRQKLSFGKDVQPAAENSNPVVSQDLEILKTIRRSVASEDQYQQVLKFFEMFKQRLMPVEELMRLNSGLTEIPGVKNFLKYLVQTENRTGGDGAANQERVKEKPNGEPLWFLDYSSCKQYGKHYRILPKNYKSETCSGRTDLCREVLNEEYVLHPSPLSDSEDDPGSDNVCKRNAYEEHIYQCEDERYELDMLMDLNDNIIKALTKLLHRIQKMPSEEEKRLYQIEDIGGMLGIADVHIQSMLRRQCGIERSKTFYEGLHKVPYVTIPLVINNMQKKDVEWREAKKGFDKMWHEACDKFYLKSLDFQGTKFKQNDVKQLRSKSLLKEIEALRDESKSSLDSEAVSRDHMVFPCQDKAIFDDSVSLVFHNINRQTGIQNEDKEKIKQILCQHLPDLFMFPRTSVKQEVDVGEESSRSSNSQYQLDVPIKIKKEEPDCPDPDPIEQPSFGKSVTFFANDNWYVFLRLHLLLCERLHQFNRHAHRLAESEERYKKLRSSFITKALQTRYPDAVDPSDSYTCFLDLIKGLMSGSIELNSYEDQLREIFGVHAYVAFTMDKLVQSIIRQLQHLVSKEESLALGALFAASSAPGQTTEQYHQKARTVLHEKVCFKICVSKKADNCCTLAIEQLPNQVASGEKSATPVPDDVQQTMKEEEMVATKEEEDMMDEGDYEEDSPPEDGGGIVGPNIKPRQVSCIPDFVIKFRRKIKLLGLDDKEWSLEPSEVAPILREGLDKLARAQWEPRKDEDKDPTKKANTSFKEFFIYKHATLFNARQIHKRVTISKNKRFNNWLNNRFDEMKKENRLTDTNVRSCSEWFDGSCDDLRSCETTRHITDNPDRPPYHSYSKYSVKFHESSSST